MRVPYGWLRELVPVSFPVAETAERLTMAGFEVEEILEVDGESVMDVSVTSNRGDALSLVGIAREVAALTRTQVTHPPIAVTEDGPDIHTQARVVVEAADLCPRYSARVILGVTIGPSPEWVQFRLIAAGVRPINNVVDATNYVMLELGQPLHAFDLATLTEQTIVVRRARPNEAFTTLDGVAHILSPNMLVIADPQRAVALAGIMGGLNTEVTDQTTNILLESAHFDRSAIRKTARANSMSTESSYRFERIVDPDGTVRAVDRAAQLIRDWAGGAIATGIIDFAQPLPSLRTIVLRPTRVNAVLGTHIPGAEMAAVLRALEMGVTQVGDDFHVAIPSFRPDLIEEMDLIEEVARITGYEHIPTTVPGHIVRAARVAPEIEFEDHVRELLTAAGLFEGLSYTLFDYRLLDQMLLPTDAPERAEVVALKNPKSEEYTHLRPSMFVSMLESLRNNARRNLDNVQIFEIGRTFRNTGGGLRYNYAPQERRVDVDIRVQQAEKLPRERRTVGIALMGRPWSALWNGGEQEVDFFWMKGIIEQFITDLGIPPVTFATTTHPTLHPGRTAVLRCADTQLAILGEVHPRVVKNFDLPGRAFLAEISVDALMDLVTNERSKPALSRFPAVDRDIAFLISRRLPAGQVHTVITAAAGNLAESVALFDVYQGVNIPEDQISLAYRITFRAADRTLADEDVDATMQTIRRALVEEVGATLR